MFFSAQLDAFIDQTASGVGLDAAEFRVRDVFLFQRLFHAVKQSGTHDAAAAVMDQHFGAAEAFYQGARVVFRVFAE